MPGPLGEAEAKKRIEAAEHTYISGFVTTKSMVKVKCKHCKKERDVKFENLVGRKSRCTCIIQANKHPPELKYDWDHVNNYITDTEPTLLLVTLTYEGYDKEIEIYCCKCTNIFPSTFHRFKSHKHRCDCQKAINTQGKRKRHRHQYAYVKNYFFQQGDKLLSESYSRKNEYLDYMCGGCGESRKQTFYYYHDCGNRCESCHGETRYSQKEMEELIVKGGDLCVGEFITVNHHLAIKCSDCSEVYHMQPRHYIRNSRCPKCRPWKTGLKLMLGYHEIKEFIESFDEKLKSTEYKGCDEPLEIECHNCTRVYKKSYQQFYQGGRCDKCNDHRSKGEKELERILSKLGLTYETQKRFSNCRNINTLPFDCYLVGLNICIEIQGQQHFFPIKAFGGQERFEQQRLHDKIKKDFCEAVGIYLIEINYLEFNKMESKLIAELAKIKSMRQAEIKDGDSESEYEASE